MPLIYHQSQAVPNHRPTMPNSQVVPNVSSPPGITLIILPHVHRPSGEHQMSDDPFQPNICFFYRYGGSTVAVYLRRG